MLLTMTVGARLLSLVLEIRFVLLEHCKGDWWGHL